MIVRRRLAAALLVLAVGAAIGPVAARPLKPEQEALIRPAGPPVNCVQITGIDHTRVRSDSVIDFYMRGRQVYRNTLPQSCPQLGFEERFAYETSLSELCNVDIITVFTESPLMHGASCGLGQFQPITGAPRS